MNDAVLGLVSMLYLVAVIVPVTYRACAVLLSAGRQIRFLRTGTVRLRDDSMDRMDSGLAGR
jgi:hypothetical protein